MYDPATTNGHSQSIWYSTLAPADASALAGDGAFTSAKLEVDVAIIGAGLAGLSVAYHLCKRGVSVAVFDKAIAIKPDYLIAYKNKATSLCWEGRVEEALKTYEQAVKHGPEDADIHKHIGIMRLLLGDFAGGWPELRKASDLAVDINAGRISPDSV